MCFLKPANTFTATQKTEEKKKTFHCQQGVAQEFDIEYTRAHALEKVNTPAEQLQLQRSNLGGVV